MVLRERSRPPGRRAFFARLKVFTNEDALVYIGRAYEFSKYGHAKQLRDDGSRYFDHPKAVTWILMTEFGITNWVAIAVALLHDLREDTFLLSHRCAVDCFGIDVAHGLEAITKRRRPRKEAIRSYLARIIEQGIFIILVKLAGRLHNMRTLGNCPKNKQVRTAKQTLRYFIPLCQRAKEMLPASSTLGDYIEAELRKECAKYL